MAPHAGKNKDATPLYKMLFYLDRCSAHSILIKTELTWKYENKFEASFL